MKTLLVLLSLTLLHPSAFTADDKPTPPINAHFSWCGEPKTTAGKLQRYEQFWKERLPDSPDEYDDHPHVTYVRKCAYRLVALYAQMGHTAKCLKTLKWLETNDEMFSENAKAPPEEK